QEECARGLGSADGPQAPAITRIRRPSVRPDPLEIVARHSALSAPHTWPWQAMSASDRPTVFGASAPSGAGMAGADAAAGTPNAVRATPEGGTIAIAPKAAAATRKNRIIGWSALRWRSAI